MVSSTVKTGQFSQAWNEREDSWNKLCCCVDQVLAKKMREIGQDACRIEKTAGSRCLEWSVRDMRFTLNMQLRDGDSPVLRIWAAAERLARAQNERRLLRNRQREVFTPVSADYFEGILEGLRTWLESKIPLLESDEDSPEVFTSRLSSSY